MEHRFLLPVCWFSPLHFPWAAAFKEGFPGGTSSKEPACQCRRHKRRRFDPWFGKIPWRRAWQPTPAFLPGESHGQRSLVGYSPYGQKELDLTEAIYHVHCFQEPSCSTLESSWSYVKTSLLTNSPLSISLLDPTASISTPRNSFLVHSNTWNLTNTFKPFNHCDL